jgi:tetratricopeptide (TPR) repeat protein
LVHDFLEAAYAELTAKFAFEPSLPVVFEMFPHHEDFSVRTIGLDALGATGACFGKVVAVDSPRALNKGAFNWASVVWHEFTHVVTLQATDYQIPRWFTEGLSELSELRRNPAVDRKLEMELYSVHGRGAMRRMAELNAGFTRPRYGMEVVICYYQARLVCEFIEERFGFPKILEMMSLYRREKNDREVFSAVLGWTLEEFDRQFDAWLQANVFANLHVFPSVEPAELETLRDRIFEDPDDADAYVKLTLGYLQQRKFADAQISASRLLSLVPDRPIGYDVMGHLAYQMKNHRQARELLEKAVQLGSENFFTHWTLGMIHWQRKDFAAAVAFFESAKKSYPGYVRPNNPYVSLAQIHLAQGQEEKAFREIELYLAREGNDFKTRIDLAAKYAEQKRTQDVVRILEQARDIHPLDFDVQEKLGQAYRQCEDWGKAVLAWASALHLAPEDRKAEIHAELALACLRLGDFDRARSHAQRSLELDPANESARRVLQEME